MCRVLVLDDDRLGALTVKQTLEFQPGTTADVALRLEDALEKTIQAVREGRPYEIFLIDQVLGPGKNGIDAMNDLRSISPDSDAIIFTGFQDSETGLQAYRAGAFRYLPKGYDNAELLYLLESLKEWRKAQREHNWQKIFSSMMESGLRQTNFQNVADVVTQHSLQLGFLRAHLFWVPTQEDIEKSPQQMLGISCSGENCIPGFTGSFLSLHDWFDLDQPLFREPVFISPRTIHTVQASPPGELCFLPMWNETVMIGVLVLDFGPYSRSMSKHEHSLLDLYAKQASIVLHHACLYNKERITSTEANIISNIGRQTNTTAATENLTSLLELIYSQVAQLIDPFSDFAVVLNDEETNELDFALRYEGGHKLEKLRRPAGEGLEGYLLANRQEIFLPYGVMAFLTEKGIKVRGKVPISWLGVPMIVNDILIGCITIHQHDRSKRIFEREKRLLVSIANQVAGAIHINRLSAIEKIDMHRLQVLQQASVEMMRITQQKEDENVLWRILLTLVTANFGLGFNRVLLLRTHENNTRLIGQTGIGTDNAGSATRDWEFDEQRNYTFEKFLADFQADKIRPTAYEKIIKNVTILLDGQENAITEVVTGQKMIILEPDELQSRLPVEITGCFSLAKCAILPLRAGRNMLGVVIVDNKHNHRAMDEKILNRLQTLLDNAGLVWETLRERKKNESLLDANYKIIGAAGHKSLAETLTSICKTARVISEADWAVIFPLLPGPVLEPGLRRNKLPYEFDLKNVGYDGNLKGDINDVIRDQPRSGGISTYVMKKGELVIDDVDNDDTIVGQLKLSEQHFIKHEGVKALTGAVIRDPYTNETIGLLYLDYRQKRVFTRTEKLHARSFASLAAVAISNLRRLDELRQHRGLDAALQIAETIGTAMNLENTLESVLQKLGDFFPKATRLCVLLYQKDENLLRFAPATMKFYHPGGRSSAASIRERGTQSSDEIQSDSQESIRKRDGFKLGEGNRGEGTIVCRVAQKALESKRVEIENVPDVTVDRDYLAYNAQMKSELCVSLMSTHNDLLGVLALERSTINAFTEDDQVLVETVGRQISIAIERAQSNEALDFKSTVAAQTAWAADIAHDINNEVGQVLTWAYLIKESVGEASPLWEYADNIESSARVLSSTGPWSDQPDQIVELDRFLENNLQDLASQRNLFAAFKPSAHGVRIKVNLTEFLRVIRQLVRNAARAMSATIGDKRLVVSTRRVNGSTVQILFQDFGPGVKDEIRSSIFQRPVTTKGRGGYGLLLTRQMIEDMGGEIRLLQSWPGQGAVFSIQLPIADDAVPVPVRDTDPDDVE